MFPKQLSGSLPTLPRFTQPYATWSNVFLTFSVFNFGFYKFHEFVKYKSWFKRKNLC